MKIASAVLAALAVAATVVLAATSPAAPAPASAPAKAAEAAKRATTVMRYACALKSNGLMRWVARPDRCARREVALDFSNQRVQACVLTALYRPAGKRARRAARVRSSGLIALGAMRRVPRGTLCGGRTYGRERPMALPARSARYFCAKPGARRLRWVRSTTQCARADRPVVVRGFKPGVARPDGPFTANPDTGSTDEDHATSIDATANDTPGDGGWSVDSVDSTGTQGKVTVNANQTITYDPDGKFEQLAPGASATDTFSYRAKKGTHTPAPATVTVTVNGVNDAPVLSGTESTKLGYVDGSAGVPISQGVAVADVDNANVHGATVTIASGHSATDDLDFTPANGITGTYDSGTGVLTLTGSASKADYQAALRSVEFSSSGSPSGDRSVSFQVEDGSAASKDSNVVSRTVSVNRAPTDIALSPSNVDENEASGSDVGTLSTTDPDAGDTHAYTLVSGAGDTDNGSFTIDGSTLKTGASFDFEAAGTRHVRVQTDDGNGGTFSKALNVTINNVNDAPTAVNLSNNSVPENEPSGTTVGTLSTTDQDAGDTFTYSLVPGPGSTDNGSFSTTGDQLKTAASFDLETKSSYSILVRSTDSNGATEEQTFTINVTNVNEAPAVDLDSGSGGLGSNASFTEDTTPASLAPNAAVTDVDDTHLESATIALTNDQDGAAEFLSVTVPGGNPITLGGTNNSDTITLSGSATKAQYEAVIQSLTYDNTSNTPNTTARSITVKVNDGALDSNVPAATVSVSATNDEPTATDQPGLSTNEDTPLAITLAGSDPENDTLSFSSDATSAQGGTISGGGTANVVYTPAQDFCGSSDSFDFTVNDGNGGSDEGTITINVPCANDAPAVDLNGNGAGVDSVASFTEDTTPASVAPNAALTDVDDTHLESATIALTNDQDGAAEFLSVTVPGGNPITLGGTNNSDTITLTGPATKAQFEAVVQSLTYDNSDDTPTTSSRNVNVTVNDGDNNSNTPHSTITVTPTNDEPTATDQPGLSTNEDTALPITLTGSDPENDTLSFSSDATSAQGGTISGGGTANVVYTPAQDFCGSSDSFDFTVNDGNGGSDEGTITIAVTCANDAPAVDLNGNGAGVDSTASFTEDTTPASLAPNAALTDVDDTHLESATIALTNDQDGAAEFLSVTVPGGNPITLGGTNNSDTITLTGPATKAQFEAVVQSLTYDNTSNTPTTSSRNVNVTVNDGDTNSNTPHSTITVTPTNDEPTATDQPGLSTNEDTALPITLTGSDPENDTLSFTSDATSAQGGTISGGGTANVVYTPAQDFCGASDSFDFTVNDGNGGSDEGTITIAVTCVNDAPVLDLDTGTAGTGSEVTFQESNGDAVEIAPAAQITDVDTGDNIESATVTLMNRPDGLSEALSVTVPSGTPVDVTGNNSDAITLTATAATTDAQWVEILESVSYDNTATPPNGADRTVQVVLNDGDAASNTASATVHVVPLNSPPLVDLDTNNAGSEDASASFTEDTTPANVAPNSSVTDADAGDQIQSAEIKITNLQDGSAESLDVNVGATGIVKSYTPGTGTLTLTGSKTPAQYESVLETLQYNNTSDTPGTTARAVTVTLYDGQDFSITRTSTVSVAATNDAPVNAVPGAQSTNEDTAKTLSDANGNKISVEDVDVAADDLKLTLSVLTGTLTLADTTGLTFSNAQGDAQMTFTGTKSAVNAALAAGLTYQPSGDVNGSDTLTVLTEDQGNSGAGGNKTDSDPITLNITPDNDVPVNTVPGTNQPVDEDTDLTFNAANSNAISVADVDAGTDNVEVVLTATNGTLTVAGGSGATVAGNTTSSVSITGTLLQVNAALNGLRFRGTSNYFGSASVEMDTSDLGHNPAPAETDNDDVVNITVNPRNDSPVADNETVSGAIGNTTLVGDDPDDGAPSPGHPNRTVTADLLTGDTDPETPGALTVTGAGTNGTNGATADGGTVTVQLDGDFTMTRAPSANCTDVQDTFLYTVSDNDSSTPPGIGTATGTVTVNFTSDCAWYVKNDAPTGAGNNDGASDTPFTTLTLAEAASGADDYVFVFNGDDGTTGLDTRYTMDVNERLIGEHNGFAVGAATLHPANNNANGHPTLIAPSGEDVVELTQNNVVDGFNIDPAGAGSGIAGAPGDTGGGTIDDVNIDDNGTAGTQAGLELDGTTGAFAISNLSVDNNDAVGQTSGSKGVKINGHTGGNVVFNPTGSISISTKGAAALDVDGTVPSPVNLGTSTFDAITSTVSASGGVSLTNTAGTINLGDGSGTDLDLTTTAGSTAALEVNNGGGVSVPSAGTSNVRAIGASPNSVGPVVDITGTANATFLLDDVDSTNSSGDAINIAGLGTGSFSAQSGDIGAYSGIGFDLDGGSGSITYPGTFANASGSTVLDITNRTGGFANFNGSIADTNDAGGGVTASGNTGGSTLLGGVTKQINTGASDGVALTFPNGSTHTFSIAGGGLDIDTTSGAGYSATGVDGNDGNVQLSGFGHTIDTGAGRALTITNTNIGANEATFERLSSNGAPNGILLSNTGSAGGLNVLSTFGGNCLSAGAAGCTGGVIQNSSGAGVALTNVGNDVNLTRVSVNNGAANGIQASSVGSSGANGIALANSFVSSNGNAVNENGLDWRDVLGVSSISDTTVSLSGEHNAWIETDAGTQRLTVNASVFTNNTNSPTGADGLHLRPDGTSTVRALVQNSFFTANEDDGFQLNAQGDSNTDLTFNNNTVNADNGVSANAGINFDAGETSNTELSMTGGTVHGASGSAIIVNPAGNSPDPNAAIASTFDATIDNVTVGTNGVAQSASEGGFGMWIKPVRNTDAEIVVKNSFINGAGGGGMQFIHNDGQGTSDFTLTNTDFRNIGFGTNAAEAILVNAGSLNTDKIDACADIGGAGALENDFAGQHSGAGITDIAFRRPNAAAGSHLKLPGFTPPASTNLQTYIQNRNVGSPTATNFSGELESGPANCQQPTTPTLP
jgi:VCBS repeat-containing protein